jgi:hypothetical protein
MGVRLERPGDGAARLEPRQRERQFGGGRSSVVGDRRAHPHHARQRARAPRRALWPSSAFAPQEPWPGRFCCRGRPYERGQTSTELTTTTTQ